MTEDDDLAQLPEMVAILKIFVDPDPEAAKLRRAAFPHTSDANFGSLYADALCAHTKHELMLKMAYSEVSMWELIDQCNAFIARASAEESPL
jgi:hypothetical protein